MIQLQERTRRISPSRLHEILLAHDCGSIVDPFMGLPTHLNYLKRHGIAVHGGDLLEWFVRVGEGIVVNDLTILRDSEVAEIVEMLPGRIYALDTFKAWEGVFFTEEQCVYLGVWHDNVRNLRSDQQTGLAILGLWRVFCYWLQKTQYADDMQDVPPSELAWNVHPADRAMGRREHAAQHRTPRRRARDHRRATSRRALSRRRRRAIRFAVPTPASGCGKRGGKAIHTSRSSTRIATRCSGRAPQIRPPTRAPYRASCPPPTITRVIVVQTTEQRINDLEPLVRNARSHVEILAPHPYEIYIVATK